MRPLAVTDRLFFSETDLNKQKVKQLVTSSLQGSHGGELFLEQSWAESFSFYEGRLKSSPLSVSEGFGLRFISDDKEGFASSGRLDMAALQNAAKAVRAIHTHGHDANIIVPRQRVIRPLYDTQNPILEMDNADKIQILTDLDQYIRSKDSHIIDVSISASAEFQAVQIIRADGHRVADLRPLTRFGVQVKMEQDGKTVERGFSFGGRYGYKELFNEVSIHHAADEAYRQAIVALNAVPMNACSVPIVMAPGWPAVMIHEAVGHGLEGDANRKNKSVYAGKIGQRVASKGVTIIDQGNIDGRRGSLNYDDEGFKTRKNVLIEDGILVGYMQDQLNARLMGAEITGNGRREAYNERPMPRMTNTIMTNGEYAPEEVIASVDHGVYVAGMSGGSVNTTTGKFNFAVTEAYLIENGKVNYNHPIKDMTVQGNGPEAMNNVIMAGNDSSLDSGIGMCGKSGQQVPVGVGQPTVRMDGLKIDGLG
ncbi:MAG: metallopeptidase TldD-related protein [Pseudomonadota bacterium]|nr:metallopeptidase TldD-related protein [Alphaproteobacteria bacterium]MED5421851.1 metallopeptidase TldD-related protein [Pseudomonadota bacterium]